MNLTASKTPKSHNMPSQFDVVHLDVHRFGLGVEFDGFGAVLSAESAQLVATERHSGRNEVVVVHPNGSALQSVSNPMGSLQVSAIHSI